MTVLALFLTASPAFANAKVLKSIENFRESVTKGWKFECADDFVMKGHLSAEDAREPVEKSLYQGLKKLEAINSALLDAVIAQVSGKTILISCRSFFEDGRDSFNATVNPLSDDVLALGKVSKLALLDGGKELFGNSLVHQFLHFAKAENLDAEAHEELHQNAEMLNARESDFVFACAAQAYPNGLILKKAEGQQFTNTQRACLTCAKARLASMKDASYPEDEVDLAKRAVEKCKDVKDADYASPIVK